MQAAVRGFLTARLDALWAGPAGRFLEGGHPVDLARLLRGNVLVTSGGVADEEAASFLAGVLLLRLAEQLSHADREGTRLAIVIALPGEPAGLALGGSPGAPPGSAGCWRTCGWPARTSSWPRWPGRWTGQDCSGRRRRSAGAVSPLLSGRRSAACGRVPAAPVRRLRAARRRIAGGRSRPGVAPALGTDAGAGLPDRQAAAPGAGPAALRAGRRSARAAASACWRP